VVVWPVVLAYALLVLPVVHGVMLWEAWVYWISLLYCQTLHYLADRPGMGRRDRFLAWLVLTPLLVPFQLVVVRPAMYWALTRLRSQAWATRGPEGAAVPAADQGRVATAP
jgi:hyaluronan synthase